MRTFDMYDLLFRLQRGQRQIAGHGAHRIDPDRILFGADPHQIRMRTGCNLYTGRTRLARHFVFAEQAGGKRVHHGTRVFRVHRFKKIGMGKILRAYRR